MRTLNRLTALHPVAKGLLVIAAYLMAFAVATAAVIIRVAATSGPEWNTYSGMLAFGDSMLFLAVFGLVSVPATGTALFFLRPCPLFWRIASVVALGIASSAISALLAYLLSRSGGSLLFSETWTTLSPIRLLMAPLFALGFFLTAMFAPIRWCRFALLAASFVELVAFACVALIWLSPPP